MVDLVTDHRDFPLVQIPVGVTGKTVNRQLAIGVVLKQSFRRQRAVHPHLRVFLVIDVKIDQRVVTELPVNRRCDHHALFFRGFRLPVFLAGKPDHAV